MTRQDSTEWVLKEKQKQQIMTAQENNNFNWPE